MSLDQLQQALKQQIEAVRFEGQPQSLYDPINYIWQLGGKRMRPLLVQLGCIAVAGNSDATFKASVAIELFHNFTLIHDDIMDQASLRRGQDTVHHKYGVNTAILAGDLMLVEAYRWLEEIEQNKDEVYKTFTQVAADVCRGQQLDLDFESQETVSIADYLEMIQLKTSVLLGGALRIGALIGNGGEETAARLYGFGVKTGLAFQLQDDILDLYSDDESFGKQVGGDIIMNKKTLLYLKALELANESQRESLLKWYSGDHDAEEKVGAVREIFEQLEVKQHAEWAMAEYHREALELLDESQLDAGGIALLQAYSDQLLVRRS
jgi:geranylgeranyl diphosphate synthase type II